MNRAQLFVLTVIATVVLAGAVGYGVLRLYAD